MTYTISKILVPIDFSEISNNAINVAIAIAKRHQAELHLLHIIQVNAYAQSYMLHGTALNYEGLIMDDINKNIQKYKEKIISEHHINITASAQLGEISISVNHYTKENNIDLVVMGTHGVSGWKEFFIGSNAMAVIKECQAPVLTVPPSFTKTTFDQILYPIRNVVGVIEKYDYIKPIIEKNDSKVSLLGIDDVKNINEKNKIKDNIKSIQQLITNHNLDISTNIKHSNNIAETILDESKKAAFDIMIINATLDTEWSNFFSGNYTQQIINHAEIPVLAIKPTLLNA